MKSHIEKNSGFTLIELVLVIVVIGIIGSIALRSMLPTLESAREEATMKEMQSLEYAIVGNPNLISDGIRSDFGYVGDIGSLPPNLDALVANPGGYTTWNGPYIMNDFVENPDDFKKDAWGDLYTYSGGVTLASNGHGNPITRTLASSISVLTSNSVSGTILDGLGTAPGSESGSVRVTIFYPDGSGSITSLVDTPAGNGYFAFSNSIPIGNHLVQAVYTSTNDTTAAYVSVVPGSNVYAELHFPGQLW